LGSTVAQLAEVVGWALTPLRQDLVCFILIFFSVLCGVDLSGSLVFSPPYWTATLSNFGDRISRVFPPGDTPPWRAPPVCQAGLPGCIVDNRDEDGLTPLASAVAANKLAVAAFLLAKWVVRPFAFGWGCSVRSSCIYSNERFCLLFLSSLPDRPGPPPFGRLSLAARRTAHPAVGGAGTLTAFTRAVGSWCPLPERDPGRVWCRFAAATSYTKSRDLWLANQRACAVSRCSLFVTFTALKLDHLHVWAVKRLCSGWGWWLITSFIRLAETHEAVELCGPLRT